MTGAQSLLEEGRQEGRQEGRLEGRQEGRQEGALSAMRKMLLRLGTRQYGSPDERTEIMLNGIALIERLEELVERLPDASGWDALLSG